jgi:hypothetical protein
MIEKPVEIPTPDGTADGVLLRPDGDGPWPGIYNEPQAERAFAKLRSLFERVLRNQRVFDDAPADQMFLDDPLEDRRIALAVPSALRIDDGDRPAFADAKAVRLGAQDSALLGQPELFETRFQKVPRGKAAILVAAFRLRLIAAEKDMPARNRHADALRDRALCLVSHEHLATNI